MARPVNGGNNYLYQGDVAATDLGPNRSFSVFCWVRADTLDANERVILGKANYNSAQVQYILFTLNNGISFQIGDSSNVDSVTVANSLSVGVWVPVVATMKENSLELWVGSKRGVGTTSRTPQNTSYNFGVGQRNDGNGFKMDGAVAHIATWRLALSNDDMVRLINGVTPRLVQPESLAGYWPLNDYGAGGQASERGGSPLLMGGSNSPVVADVFAQPVLMLDLPVGAEVIGPQIYAESATVYFDLQPSATEVVSISELATVLLDLQAISTFEGRVLSDAATVLLDLSVQGGECYSRFHMAEEGEADWRWEAADTTWRWDVATGDWRWYAFMEIQPGC